MTRFRMRAVLLAAAALPFSVGSVSAQAGAQPQSDSVRNIILMVADGAGAGVWTAAIYGTEEKLAVQTMPVVGLLDTRSSSSKVTDSAAGASVYATGERTTNRTISVSGCPLPSSRDTLAVAWPDGCEAVDTWFALAREKGKAAGIVTTTTVIDATPAAFVAHSPSRYWRLDIAEQFADSNLDVLLGGGRAWFDGATRADGKDLLAGMCARAACISTAAELDGYEATDRPLVGLFTPGDMDDSSPRPVSVPDMVEAALEKLSRDPDGFVAVFETEATDNATHANQPLERVTADILEFDRAVAVALEFAERTPGTLVVVTSDHETGGFSLAEIGQDFELKYTTRGHSAEIVPLFAAGPQSERFGGFRNNYEVGRTLFEIVRGWE